jgi:hypothetical protein
MAQGYKGAIPFHVLCQYLYEGFGQWAVMSLVKDRQSEGYLSDVDWKDCDGCDWHSPYYEGSCLVCGGN